MILVGSDEKWISLRKETKHTPPNGAFYREVKKLLQEKGARFTQITDLMDEVQYADDAGHVATEDYEKLARKLMESFQNICEEAWDARAAATQQRPRRSDAGSETRSRRASGSRVDVLVAANTYRGWEQDLFNEHGIIFNAKTGNKKHSFHCQICKEHVPKWADVPIHCKGEKHQKAAQQEVNTGSGSS